MPLRPDRDPLRQRLAEVRAELDRLRALETDLVGLLGRQARPEPPRYDGRRGRLVVRPGLSRLLRAIGREVTAMPLLDCPCPPDCPCDDRPPGCC